VCLFWCWVVWGEVLRLLVLGTYREVTQTSMSWISTRPSASTAASSVVATRALTASLASSSSLLTWSFEAGACRCRTGLLAKKLPGVCSWCSEKGVKSSTLGAVVIVVSDMFGDSRVVLLLLDGMESVQWLRESHQQQQQFVARSPAWTWTSLTCDNHKYTYLHASLPTQQEMDKRDKRYQNRRTVDTKYYYKHPETEGYCEFSLVNQSSQLTIHPPRDLTQTPQVQFLSQQQSYVVSENISKFKRSLSTYLQ
jgi:hypothetical protein